MTVNTDPVDVFLGSVRHKDTITPGGTASVHVLRGFSVLFTVGVAEGQRTGQQSHVVKSWQFFHSVCSAGRGVRSLTWVETWCPLPWQHHERLPLLCHISKAEWQKPLMISETGNHSTLTIIMSEGVWLRRRWQAYLQSHLSNSFIYSLAFVFTALSVIALYFRW